MEDFNKHISGGLFTKISSTRRVKDCNSSIAQQGLHPMFQDTYYWCLRDSESQHLDRIGTWVNCLKEKELFFLPTSKMFCPLFNYFAQLGSRLPRQEFILPFFKFRAWKGVFWGGVGGVLCMYISQKWVCDSWVKNRGWGWYSGQNETPSGQNKTHLGILYEKWQKYSRIGKKKIQSCLYTSMKVSVYHKRI